MLVLAAIPAFFALPVSRAVGASAIRTRIATASEIGVDSLKQGLHLTAPSYVTPSLATAKEDWAHCKPVDAHDQQRNERIGDDKTHRCILPSLSLHVERKAA